MEHLAPLIQELTLILITAGVVSLVFKRLKQPIVLAYIVAGIILSFFVTEDNPEYTNIETWAEIGIIFLLFGLGLEFSFKKLMKVGVTAVVATSFIVICMIGVGYFLGLCFGWSHMASLFLGAMLSISSTMIIIKVFEDLHYTKRNFARIVMGVLIMEDLFAVLLMVLLSTIAVSNKFEGMEMLYSLFKLATFLLFWFLLGTYLIPVLLRKAKRFLDDETIMILSLALCLGMVFLATAAGFSSALGAFIMGSILAETMESERIEKLVLPIKNLFGAVFFVSVGLMVKISSLGEHIVPILIITAIVVIGRMIIATGGVLLAGQNLKTSVSAGFSLAQIGEFSYIIAALGMSFKVIEDSMYQIIVSVSVLTLFVTPYVVRLAEPANNFLERLLPQKWQDFLNKNTSGAHLVNRDSLWKKLLIEIGTTVLIYYVISIIIVNASLAYACPFVRELLPDIEGNLLVGAATIVILAPFLRVIIIKKNRSIEYLTLWNESKSNRGPLVSTIVCRVFICAGLIVYLLQELFHLNVVISVALAAVILLSITRSKKIKARSLAMETRFKENFNEKEKYRESKAPLSKGFVNHVMERDLHLSEFSIEPYFPIVGKTLKELNFRQLFGVSIVTIVRGSQRINIPNGNERIYPGDHVIVLGTDTQMEQFQARLEEKRRKYETVEAEITPEVRMRQFQISSESHLIGETIRTSKIQEVYNCLVIGIERNDTSIQNPDLDLVLEEGDVVWIIGEYNNILKICEL
ncbi:MAG: cation:proton antiporter [Dysgonamonadaceae bacterium]|jgi:CPA2 family monovalent cation:H+ antiporter-2|nr:cation:proton antiporter [Dysgonamonadaceae bacterium]